MEDNPPGGYKFGPFELDLEQHLLLRAGEAVPLTPKVFETLAVLVARAGTVVDKLELIRVVWPDSFVEENNLTQNISALRKALGADDYIETIPRRGYRFSMPVERVLLLNSSRLRNSGQPIDPVDSLLVLPFVNMTAEPDDEYFSDGLTEELTNAMAHLSGLRVVARTTAFQFKGKAQDVRSIAQQLRVSTVLEGSVRRQAKKLRVTVQLIDARSGFHIWSQTFDREPGDIFAIQEDIAGQVANTIRPDSRPVFSIHRTKNLETYNLYLLGRFHRGKPDRPSVRKAMVFFQRAIDRDPSFAAAYAGLAECYIKLAQENSMPPMEAWAAAQKAVDQAIAFDDTLVEAHTTQAIVHLLMDRNWKAAERQFLRAIELNKNDAAAHHWFSHYYTAMGRTDESLSESLTALELDPLDVQISGHMIFHYVRARDYPNAIQAGMQTLDLDPHSKLAYMFLTWAYEDTEQWDKAIDASQRANGIYPEALVLHSAVRADGALGYWRANQAVLAEQENPDNYRLAVCHARLGEEDKAIARLERAFQRRETELIYLRREPAFDWIKANPRFRALTEALKLP